MRSGTRTRSGGSTPEFLPPRYQPSFMSFASRPTWDAHIAVTNCLRSLGIVSVDRTTLEMAATLNGSDFEDNLHIACAVQASLDAIVTRNRKDFAGSPAPVLTPAELLALLARGPEA